MAEYNKEMVVRTKGSIGFLGALGLIFITLKLCGVINWSWIWVLAPIWIPFLFSAIICSIIVAIVMVVFFIALLVGYIEGKKK